MHPRRTNCTLTKAASIPARRQRAQGFLDLFFDAAPHLEYLVLSSKNWKKYSRWGAASKNKSKKPWVCIFTLLPCRNRCRFSESGFLFAGAPTIENRIEQKIQNTKVASAKVAFDTVRQIPVSPYSPNLSGKKKKPNPNFWVRIFSGGLPREGVGAKKFGMSLETQGNQTFGQDFCRDIPVVHEKFEKKVCVWLLAPNLRG